MATFDSRTFETPNGEVAGMTSHDELMQEMFSDEERDEVRFDAAFEMAEMELGELREKRGLTQNEVAERMRTAQPRLSQIENSEDYYLSTLKRYVEALGGELEICVSFDDDDEQVRIRV